MARSNRIESNRIESNRIGSNRLQRSPAGSRVVLNPPTPTGCAARSTPQWAFPSQVLIPCVGWDGRLRRQWRRCRRRAAGLQLRLAELAAAQPCTVSTEGHGHGPIRRVGEDGRQYEEDLRGRVAHRDGDILRQPARTGRLRVVSQESLPDTLDDKESIGTNEGRRRGEGKGKKVT